MTRSSISAGRSLYLEALEQRQLLSAGYVIREHWTVEGWSISDLTSDPDYQNDNPDSTSQLSSLEFYEAYPPASSGSRIQGYITAPEDGYYTFWVSADDAAQFYLSSTEDPGYAQLLVDAPTSTDFEDFDAYPQEESSPVWLGAGQSYYFEVLQKDGSDNWGISDLSVAWSDQGDYGYGLLSRQVITGDYLSPYGYGDLPDDSGVENLEATSYGSDGMIVSFNGDPTGQTEYIVAGFDPNGSEVGYAMFPGNITQEDGYGDYSYLDTGLTPGTNYTFEVMAYDPYAGGYDSPQYTDGTTDNLQVWADYGTTFEGGTSQLSAYSNAYFSNVSYSWDLNDNGVYGESNGSRGNENGQSVMFSAAGLDGPGVYTVGVEATLDGVTAWSSQNVNIMNVDPILTISGNPTVTAGLPYTLNLSGTNEGPDTITSWHITWGDGTTSTISGNPSSAVHTYTSVQVTPQISATATDEDGTYTAKVAGPSDSTVLTAGAPGVYSVMAGQSYLWDEAVASLGGNIFRSSGTAYTGNFWIGLNGELYVGSSPQIRIYPDERDWVTAAANSAVLYRFEDTNVDGVPDLLRVQWTNVEPSTGGMPATFQAVVQLNNPAGTDSQVYFNYLTMPGTDFYTTIATYGAALVGMNGQLLPQPSNSPWTMGTITNLTINAREQFNLQVICPPPVLAISGASSVNEGNAYTLNLSATPYSGDTVNQWTINWGDGTPAQVVSGSPASVAHTYADGPSNYVISATATDAVSTYSAGNTIAVSVNDTGGSMIWPDYASGMSIAGMKLNGAAAINGTNLRITDNGSNESGSAFFLTTLDTAGFETDFQFHISGDADGDGFGFVIQNDPAGYTADGGGGGGLGFTGLQNSVAITFDLYNNAGEGDNSTGLYIDPTDATDVNSIPITGGVDLHGGATYDAHFTYSNGTLTMTVADIANSGNTFTTAWAVNIPAAVDGSQAYFGFTGGTGGAAAIQDIENWTYVSTASDEQSSVISLTSPAGGAQFSSGSPTIAGIASTGAGSASDVLIRIYRGDPSTTGVLVQTLEGPRDPDTGLFSVQAGNSLPAGQYWVQAQQDDGIGNIALSGVRTFWVVSAAPIMPVGLAVTAMGPVSGQSTSDVQLTWSAPDSSEQVSSYTILMSTDGGQTYSTFATVGGDQTSYIATGLSPDTSYSFEISASNAAGSSLATVGVSAETSSRSSGNQQVTVSTDRGMPIEFKGDGMPYLPTDGTLSFLEPAADGTVSIDSNGYFAYTPDAGFVGQDSFAYTYTTVHDDSGADNTEVGSITVNVEESAPSTPNLSVSVLHDLTLESNLGATAPGGDWSDSTIVILSPVSNGTLTWGDDDEFTYVPAYHYVGDDSFEYEITDGVITSEPATVTIHVTDQAPFADYPGSISVSTQNEGYGNYGTTTVALNPDGYNRDDDGDLLTYYGGGGIATVTSDGDVILKPTSADTYFTSFTYWVSDGPETSNPTTVTVWVNPPAQYQEGMSEPLGAVSDMQWVQVQDYVSELLPTYSTEHDQPLVVSASDGLAKLVEDLNSGGPTIELAPGGEAQHGDVTVSADGSFTYTPDPGFVGDDYFTYTAVDGDLNSGEHAIWVQVKNTPPSADNLSYTVEHDQELDVTPGRNAQGVGGLLASYSSDDFMDNDPAGYQTDADGDVVYSDGSPVTYGDPITAVLVDGPIHGNLVSASGEPTLDPDGGFNYQPDPGYVGPDYFTYYVTDGTQDTDVYKVEINVTGDVPATPSATYNATHDQYLIVPAVSGLLSPSADPTLGTSDDFLDTTAQLVDTTQHGQLTLNSDGSFAYLPDPGFMGEDSFVYCDANSVGEGNVAVMLINVGDNAPVVGNGDNSYTLDSNGAPLVVGPDEGLLDGASDPDGDTLSVSLVSGPTQGNLSLNSDGSFIYFPNSPAEEPDSFQYVVTDGLLASAVQTAEIDGTQSASWAGTSVDEFFSVAHDSALLTTPNQGLIAMNHLAGAPAGEVTVNVLTPPSEGVLTMYDDGTFLYLPPAGFTGPVSFTYELQYMGQDSGNPNYSDRGPASVSINVTDNAPVMQGGQDYAVAQGRTLVVNREDGLGTLASDADGDPLTFSVVGNQGTGTLNVSPSGAFTYTPAAGFSGWDYFEVAASDGIEQSAPFALWFDVAADSAPSVVNMTYTLPHDSTLVIPQWEGLLSQATDPEGDALTVSLVGLPNAYPPQGTLNLLDDGSFSYTPPAGFTGADYATFVVTDSAGNVSQEQTVSFNVTDTPPVASPQSYSVEENEPLAVSVDDGMLANSQDADGDPLKAVKDSDPAHGTLEDVDDGGGFVYIPATGFTGDDTFSFHVTDGAENSDTQWVTINVTPPDASGVVANDDTYTVNHRTSDGLSASELVVDPLDGVLANDTDNRDLGLTASLISGPQNGQLILGAAGSFNYIPNLAFSGTDTFTYRAQNAEGEYADATVTINVAETAPTGNADSYSVAPNDTLFAPVSTGVLANDSDAEGDQLSASLAAGPSHGSLNFDPSGAFTYTPNNGFTGTDTFSYNVSDGTLASGPITVSILVTATPSSGELPVAQNDSFTLEHDSTLIVHPGGDSVLTNDVSNDNDPLIAVLASGVSHGTLDFSSSGGFTYTPSAGFYGTDSFTYYVVNSHGQSSPATATLNVNYTAPTAQDQQFSVHSGTALDVSWLDGLLGTVMDADGDLLSASVVSETNDGGLSLSSDGAFTYTPAAGFVGTDSFTYQVSDGISQSATATVTISVYNSAPTAPELTYSGPHDQKLFVGSDTGLLSQATDADGDPLTVTILSDPADGSLTTYSTGAFVYTPDTHFVGDDYFTYEVSDGTQTSFPETVTIGMTNTVPSFTNYELTFDVTHDQPLIVSKDNGLLSIAQSGDDDPISLANVTSPTHGTLTWNADGSFYYQPAAGYYGSDSFTYQVSDGVSLSSPMTASITVHYSGIYASAYSYDTTSNTPLIVYSADGVLTNDSVPDGEPLTLSVVSGPSHGQLVLAQNGAFTYVPDANWSGPDQFTYGITDGISASSGIVSLYVNSSVPFARDAYFSVTPNQPFLDVSASGPTGLWTGTGNTGNLLDISSNVPATFQSVVVSGPTHGVLTLTPHGDFTYVPNAGFTGTDSFTYEFRSAAGTSNTGTITLYVASDLSFPGGQSSQYFSTLANQDLTQTIVPPTSNQDSSAGLMPNYSFALSDTSHLHGTVTLAPNGTFLYVPAQNYSTSTSSPDYFTYHVTDGITTLTGEVSLSVNAAAPTFYNNGEFGRDGYGNSIAEFYVPYSAAGTSYTNSFSLLEAASSSDSMPVSVALTYDSNYTTHQGTLSIQSNGSFVYTYTGPALTQGSSYAQDVFAVGYYDQTGEIGEFLVVININYTDLVYNPHLGDNSYANPPTYPGNGSDTYSADQLNALTAKGFADAAGDIAQAKTLLTLQEAEQVSDFAAQQAAATQNCAATATQNQAVESQLVTLAGTLRDQDETRLAAIASDEAANMSSNNQAHMQDWTSVNGAELAFNAAVNSAMYVHVAAEMQDQAAYNNALNAAGIGFNNSVAISQSNLISSEDAHQVAYDVAEQSALQAYQSTSNSLNASLQASLNSVEGVRDAALQAAALALRTSEAGIQATLNSAEQTALSAFDSVASGASSTRTSALAAAESAYETALSSAAATYASGTQDQGGTTAFDLPESSGYLAAVASAQLAYDAAVAGATSAYDDALAAAIAERNSTVEAAREAADTSEASAQTTYNIAAQSADATYQNSVQSSTVTYNNQMDAVQSTYQNALTTAQQTFNTAMQNADIDYRNASATAQSTLTTATAQALGTYDAALVSAQDQYEQTMAPADTAYQAQLLSARNQYTVSAGTLAGTLATTTRAAENAFDAASASALLTYKTALAAAESQRLQSTNSAQTALNTATTGARAAFESSVATADTAFAQAEKTADQELQAAGNANYAAMNQALAPANNILAAAEKHFKLYFNVPFIDGDQQISTLAEAVKIHQVAVVTAQSDYYEANDAAQIIYTESINSANTTHNDATEAAQVILMSTLANAVDAFDDAKAQADQVYNTSASAATSVYGTDSAAANSAESLAISAATATYLDGLADAGNVQSVTTGDAADDHAYADAAATYTRALAEGSAGQALSVTMAGLDDLYNSAIATASAQWNTEQATAVDNLSVSDAAVARIFAIDSASDQAAFTTALADDALAMQDSLVTAGETYTSDISLAENQFALISTQAAEDFAASAVNAATASVVSSTIASSGAVSSLDSARNSAVSSWASAQGTRYAAYVASQITAQGTLRGSQASALVNFGYSYAYGFFTLIQSDAAAQSAFATSWTTASNTYQTSSSTAQDNFDGSQQSLIDGSTASLGDAGATQATELADAQQTLLDNLASANETFSDSQSTAFHTLSTASAQATDVLTEDIANVDAAYIAAQAAASETYARGLADAQAALTNAQAATADAQSRNDAAAQKAMVSALYPAWKKVNLQIAQADRDLAKAQGQNQYTTLVAFSHDELLRKIGNQQGAVSELTANSANSLTHASNLATYNFAASNDRLARDTAWYSAAIPALNNVDPSSFINTPYWSNFIQDALRPGTLESLIPVWGSARNLVYNLEMGNYWTAGLDAVFLALDLTMVGGLISSVGKFALEFVAEAATEEIANAGAELIETGIKEGIELGAEDLGEQGAKAIEELGSEELANRSLEGAVEVGDRAAEETGTRVEGCVNGGCFAAGTQVVVSQDPTTGQYVTENIQDIQVGDTVLTRDQNDPDGPLQEQTVTATVQHVFYSLQVITVTDPDGTTDQISSTTEHPYYVEGKGWTAAADLQPGDILETPDSGTVTVASSVLQQDPNGVIVYNLEVGDDHTYFVDDGSTSDPIWVHNGATCFVRQVPYGSTDLSQAVVAYRQAFGTPLFRNVAAFRVGEEIRIFVSGAITGLHAEEVGLETLSQAEKASVAEVYSELRPCSEQIHDCLNQLNNYLPDLKGITYSFWSNAGKSQALRLFGI